MIPEFLAPLGQYSIPISAEKLISDHERLGEALYAILRDTITDGCIVGSSAIRKYFTDPNGFF